MKQSHCIEDTAGFAEGGDAGGQAGGKPRLLKAVRSHRRSPVTHAVRSRNFTFSLQRFLLDHPCSAASFWSKLRAPHRGTSLGPLVCGANKMHYVGTPFTLKMNSNDKILSDNIANKQHINVLKLPQKFDWRRSSPTNLTLSPIWVIGILLFYLIGRLFGFKCRCQALYMFCVFLNP